MLNPERAQLPELQLLCGVSATKPSHSSEQLGEFAREIAQLIALLHEHNQFDAPSLDVFIGLHALSDVSSLLDPPGSGVIEFGNLSQCVRAISDLESVGILFAQLDSPGFAMWCGSHSSTARTILTSLRQRVESRLQLLRSMSTSIDVIAPVNPLAVDELQLCIRQASIVGVPVRSVQLLYSDSFPAAQIKKWSKKLRKAGAGAVISRSGGKARELSGEITGGFSRGRVLKPGSLLELEDGEYLYVLGLKRVGSLHIEVGILENYVVIDHHGVRRFLALPAACSRMHARNVTVSSEHISIYFTVKEELWPITANR